MATRLVTLTAGLLIAAAGSVSGQTADELIAKNIEARGGAARLKSLGSVRIQRTYGTFGANIPVTITRKRSGLYRTDQQLPGRPAVARGLDAQGAWESIDGKVSVRPADQTTELRELDADFDGFLVDYREKGHAVESLGRVRIGGVETYKLKVTLRSGAIRYVYLDATTFLERRHEGTMTLPNGPVPIIITFSDWRDVEGIRFPFAIDEERNSFPPQTFAIYTEKVELNPPVEDAFFAKPQ